MLRSYRAVFALEYRVYRVQRWMLPFPGGVALSTIAWTMGTAVAVLVLGAVPGLGWVLGLLPAPVRDLGVPIAVGVLLSRYRPDGRSAPLFVGAVARFAVSPRHVDAFCRCAAPGRVMRITDPIVLAPGPADAGYRAGRLAGPATLELRSPAQLRQLGGQMELRPAAGHPRARGRQLRLRRDRQLVIRRCAPPPRPDEIGRR